MGGKTVVQQMSTMSARQVVEDNTNTAVITSFPLPTATVQAQSGMRGKWIETEGKPRSTVWFLGAADGGTINYKVYLHYRTMHEGNVGYLPKYIGGGVATLSLYAATVAGVGTVADVLADMVTDTSGLGKLVVRSPADDTPGYIEFDNEGAEYYEVMTDLGTATNASALCQLGDEPRPFSTKASLDLISTYTLYDGWRVGVCNITAKGSNAGVTMGAVTGVIEASFVGVVTTAVVGTSAETIAVYAGSSSGVELIAATTATKLIANEIWHDTDPDQTYAEDASQLETWIINGAVATSITLVQSGTPTAWTPGGELDVYVRWRPISSDGDYTPTDVA